MLKAVRNVLVERGTGHRQRLILLLLCQNLEHRLARKLRLQDNLSIVYRTSELGRRQIPS